MLMLHSSYYLQQLRDILSSYYFQQLRDILYIAPVVLIAIMGHEFAHGWVSNRLGDPTPRMDGRLTLNPLKHLDPFGTLCLIFFKMGWAKPVRINTRYYKNRKSGIIMVSLAGPFMNFILAFLSLLLFGLLGKYGSAASSSVSVFLRLFYYSAVMNIGLGVFNLIPIPPLDGSNVLAELWPGVSAFYQRIRPYRTWIFVILLASGALSRTLGTANTHILNSLWGIVNLLLNLNPYIPNTGVSI